MEDRPRPVASDKQNALVFHSVMVSGTFTANSPSPDTLVWRKKNRKNKQTKQTNRQQTRKRYSETKRRKHGTKSRGLVLLLVSGSSLLPSSPLSVCPSRFNFLSPPTLFSLLPFFFPGGEDIFLFSVSTVDWEPHKGEKDCFALRL